MSARNVSLVVIASLIVCAGAAFAQPKLGDLVTEEGYDWIIGRWVAAGDGGKVEMEYQWGLDKNVVLAGLKMGEYRNRGIILMAPDREEIVETAADNMGGIWRGAWTEENGDLVQRVEYTTAAGEVHKGDVVHTKVDNDTITIAMYATESGSRSSEPMNKLTYKRQPVAAAADAVSAEPGGRATDYQKLGDLVAEGGYEWLAGKWLAGDDDGQYELEHKWALDKHAILMDLKIGDFAYHGMVMYLPARQEIIQVGADNMGGAWKGTWEQGDEGATHKVEYTGSDGTTRRMEHVYLKTDNDTFQVKEYGVVDGSRSSDVRRLLTFKRQKAPTASK